MFRYADGQAAVKSITERAFLILATISERYEKGLRETVSTLGDHLKVPTQNGGSDPRQWIGSALRFWTGVEMNTTQFGAEERRFEYTREWIPVLIAPEGYAKATWYGFNVPDHVQTRVVDAARRLVDVSVPSISPRIVQLADELGVTPSQLQSIIQFIKER